MQYSDSDQRLEFLDGAITSRVLAHHPGRAFACETTFDTAKLTAIPLFRQKPPAHFHPYQEEYLEVLEGAFVVEVEGVEHVRTPEDGEFRIRPWADHRVYPPLAAGRQQQEEDSSPTVRVRLSGQATRESYQLDILFFENWYHYQNYVITNNKTFDIVQVMSMFDAGGSYSSLPSWIPFSKTIARALGVVVGRWIGGLLGYRPFYREWSTDWDLAREKMGQSFFQRRGLDRSKIK